MKWQLRYQVPHKECRSQAFYALDLLDLLPQCNSFDLYRRAGLCTTPFMFGLAANVVSQVSAASVADASYPRSNDKIGGSKDAA